MELLSSVILTCAGADTARASGCGHAVLDLCLGLNEQGSPIRFSLPPPLQKPRFLGLRDVGHAADSANPAQVADALVYECSHSGAQGLFADLETDGRGVRQLASALDAAFFHAKLLLFFPAARAREAQHAVLTYETAVSGGSLRGLFQQAITEYGKDRVAALLRPVCADFQLPSSTAEGSPLTQEARRALQQARQAQAFFSHELCAKYFTYMDEEKQGHFVLFDDDSTIENKLSCLSRAEVPYLFALYPEVAHLL